MKEQIPMATGPTINFKTIPHNVNPTPQAIIFSCNAMNKPAKKKKKKLLPFQVELPHTKITFQILYI